MPAAGAVGDGEGDMVVGGIVVTVGDFVASGDGVLVGDGGLVALGGVAVAGAGVAALGSGVAVAGAGATGGIVVADDEVSGLLEAGANSERRRSAMTMKNPITTTTMARTNAAARGSRRAPDRTVLPALAAPDTKASEGISA
jgi:hypothetical protein